MNTRSTNDSKFRYGHFTNSCLEIFDKIPVLEPIESSHVQIKVGLQKGRLFDDFMKKDEHGKADMGMSFKDDDLHYLTHVNNLLHSLFSNCDVYLNNQQVYNSNGLYGHKA